MKKLIFILLIVSGKLHAQKTIYSLSVQTSSQDSVILSEYEGAKVLMILASTDKVKASLFSRLDSLQQKFPLLRIVIIPKGIQKTDTAGIADASSSKFVIGQSVDETNQSANSDSILTFLTSRDRNGHFDSRVTSDLQMYVINESGRLYAALQSVNPDWNVLYEVLGEPDSRLPKMIVSSEEQVDEAQK